MQATKIFRRTFWICFAIACTCGLSACAGPFREPGPDIPRARLRIITIPFTSINGWSGSPACASAPFYHSSLQGGVIIGPDWRRAGLNFQGFEHQHLGMPPPSEIKAKGWASNIFAELHIPAGKPFMLTMAFDRSTYTKDIFCLVSGSFIPKTNTDYEIQAFTQDNECLLLLSYLGSNGSWQPAPLTQCK
jgi:hypothetical protein